MKRIITALLLVSAASGCVSSTFEPETGGMRANYGRSSGPPSVPGVEGPYGSKVPMAGPYNQIPPGSSAAALAMMNANVPLSRVQMNPGGLMTPPGVTGMPGMMPGVPAGMPGMMPGGPGGMPGMMPGGPGGMPGGMPGMMPGAGGNPFQKTSMASMMGDAGVMNANVPPGANAPAGLTKAQFANSSPVGSLFPAQRTQVFFPKPAGMKIYWFTQGADGKPNYSATPLETPGRYNFAQGAIYRLKLTHIPGRPSLELFPTLEVVPTSPKTNEFLAHNSVPVEFTEDDFKQVVDRNYIVKVIYLPDPQFQDAAGAGPDEINSTRLEPGQDPIQEALRRGSILLVLRIGNIDQGLQHSPPTTAPIPGPSGPPMMMKPPGQGVMPFNQVPFPLTPVVPGGMGQAPNQLPPLQGNNAPQVNGPNVPNGNAPPPGNVPNLPIPAAPVGQPDVVLPPLPDNVNRSIVAPFDFGVAPLQKLEVDAKPKAPVNPPLPPVVAPTEVKPLVPPVPAPTDKGQNNTNAFPPLPVIPASTTKEISTDRPILPLPALPTVDTSTPGSRPDLPPIPIMPSGKQ